MNFWKRIFVIGLSDSPCAEEEYKPITLTYSEASWVMDMIIEVQIRRARATPKLEDGERDELLLRMADLLAAPENNVPFVPGVPNISIQQRNIKRDCLRDFVNKFKDR